MVDFKLSVLLGNVLQIAGLASDFIYETSDFRKKNEVQLLAEKAQNQITSTISGN